MQWFFMVALVVMVMVAGIMVIVTYKTEVSITKAYGMAENFLNPNIIGFEEKPEIQIKCIKGNKYNFVIKDLKLFYKSSDKTLADVRIDLGSETELKMLPNTPFTIPMENGVDISFDYTLPDTLEFQNKEKILIRLTFWEYGTSKSCYAINRNLDSSVLLEKCTKSYLGSANMIIDKGQFDVGECVTTWRLDIGYGTPSKSVEVYLGKYGWYIDTGWSIKTKEHQLKATVEKVENGAAYINLELFLKTTDEDIWHRVVNNEKDTNPQWYCGDFIMSTVRALKAGDKKTCAYQQTPLAKIYLKEIDYQTRVIKLDVNPTDSDALSGGWSVLPSTFIVNTNEGYNLGALYAVLTSHSVPEDDVNVHNFILTVESVESFDNPSEIVCKDVDFRIDMDKDDKYSTVEDCGPYKLKITNVNGVDNRISVEIIIPDDIKNIKRGQSDYCEKIIYAKFGKCFAYQGVCSDSDECATNLECNIITYSGGNQDKICTEKTPLEMLTNPAQYIEWNNNAVTEYMKWKTNNDNYVYTDEGEQGSDSDNGWVYPGGGS